MIRRLLDRLFPRSPAPEPEVDVPELVRRGNLVILHGGKRYLLLAKEVGFTRIDRAKAGL